MRKFFQIAINFWLLLALMSFSSKALAYTNNFCDNPVVVKVDQNNNFNTTLTIDTKSNLNMKGLAGDTIQVMTDAKKVEGVVSADGTISVSFGKTTPGPYGFSVWEGMNKVCSNGSFTVPDVGQGGSTTGTNITFTPSSPTSKDTINVRVQNLTTDGSYFYSVVITANPSFSEKNVYGCGISANKTFEFKIPALPGGTWAVNVMKNKSSSTSNCSSTGTPVALGQIVISSSPVSLPDLPNMPTPPVSSFYHCAKLSADGVTCIAVDTAIGTISTEPQGFVRRIFELVLGLAGGIALILIIISGYRYMISQGNPEALKAATEQLTSAIIGLLFIILSFVILEIIGVDILRIPGFQR